MYIYIYRYKHTQLLYVYVYIYIHVYICRTDKQYCWSRQLKPHNRPFADVHKTGGVQHVCVYIYIYVLLEVYVFISI